MTDATEEELRGLDRRDIFELYELEPPEHINVALTKEILEALRDTEFGEKEKQAFAEEVCASCFCFQIYDEEGGRAMIKAHKALKKRLPTALKQFDKLVHVVNNTPSDIALDCFSELAASMSRYKANIIETYGNLQKMNALVQGLEEYVEPSGPTVAHGETTRRLYRLYKKHFNTDPTTSYKKEREVKDLGDQRYRNPSTYDKVCAIIEKYYAIIIPESQRKKIKELV